MKWYSFSKNYYDRISISCLLRFLFSFYNIRDYSWVLRVSNECGKMGQWLDVGTRW